MKKLLPLTVMIAGFLFFNGQAHAARTLDLSGNEYNVYFLCGDDVGDYCDQGKIQTDTFIFASDSDNFGIKSFGDNLLDFLGDNTYSASGLTFDANYSAVDGLNTYDFTIKGLNFADIILFGTMDISYTEYVVFPPDKNITEGKAIFIGIKK
jgi:hypothetical protein